MRLLVGKYNLKDDKGSVLMEAIICLPVLLLLSLGVAQFAHIWYCRTIVHYAAYSAARATLTAPADDNGEQNKSKELTEAQAAAEIICRAITFTSLTDDLENPGVGKIGGSGNVKNKCKVSILDSYYDRASEEEKKLSQWQRGVEVEMNVPLLFPYAGQIIGACMKMWSDNGDLDIQKTNPSAEKLDEVITHNSNIVGDFFFPHIILRERAYISKPFLSTWTTP